MDRILIRFNTKHSDDPQGRKWRLLINNQESLAHHISIRIPCETITEEVAPGVTKYHILCYGTVYWPEPNMAVIQ
jgi:hypothetical protein